MLTGGKRVLKAMAAACGLAAIAVFGWAAALRAGHRIDYLSYAFLREVVSLNPVDRLHMTGRTSVALETPAGARRLSILAQDQTLDLIVSDGAEMKFDCLLMIDPTEGRERFMMLVDHECWEAPFGADPGAIPFTPQTLATTRPLIAAINTQRQAIARELGRERGPTARRHFLDHIEFLRRAFDPENDRESR